MIGPQPNPHVLALLSSFGPWASTEASIPILDFRVLPEKLPFRPCNRAAEKPPL